MAYPVFVLDLDGASVRFCLATQAVSGAYPYLAEVGALRSAARAAHLAGIGSGEAPSVSVSLNNPGRRTADLIGLPLRRRARIELGDEVLFDGLVSSVSFGTIINLEMAA